MNWRQQKFDKENMQTQDINIATNPKLYRACQRFYAAGYKQKPYPRPLNKVQVSMRLSLKRAYREGLEQHQSEVRLAQVLYGA
jgi:hypothetical protein